MLKISFKSLSLHTHNINYTDFEAFNFPPNICDIPVDEPKHMTFRKTFSIFIVLLYNSLEINNSVFE